MQRILIIEDETKVANALRTGLEAEHYEVTIAATGEEGFFLASQGSFDLLLLDIFMPGMDGLETMRMIHRKKPKMPIIVISGRPFVPDLSPEPDYLGMATKLGAVCSLPKPFKPAVLLETVEGCLNARKRNAASGP